ncbi:tetratricopeptide repeat protein [Owenweeksia hongkongensis]|uniref:tetratricopeptide repeat protein n=1 Tax=Owenweeksia hongkongensis TaxID=253245 RepID=UPI003A91CF56
MSSITFQKSLAQYGVLLLISLLMYGYTTTFDYALDDALYIPENSFTKQGLGGIADHFTHEAMVGFYGEQKNLLTGGRYRPLTPITYSLEYAVYGLNPAISHLINVLLYAMLLMMMVKLISRFQPTDKFFSFAFITALLFAVHPLHVEVVANIKGRDQILALLSLLATVTVSFSFFNGKKLALLSAGLLFFIGLLAKESTITFLPIIPLAFYFLKDKSIKGVLPLFAVLLTFSVLWFLLRSWVIQGFESVESTTLLNDPFMNSTTNEWLGTMLYTWLIYLKLLIVPFPLTHDYYPFHIAIRGLANFWSILSLLIHAGLAVLMVIGFQRRKFYAFLILLYAATFSISSNLFFNIGTFMNERFMFEPSLAFALLLAGVFVYKLPQKAGIAITLSLSLVFGLLSFNRSFAWKDNYTLFTTDVKVSEHSIKVLTASGGVKLERAETLQGGVEKNRLLDESISELQRSVTLSPVEIIPHRLLGKALYERNGINPGTAEQFLAVLEQIPDDNYVLRHVEFMISQESVEAQQRLVFALQFEDFLQNSFDYNFQVGLMYGRYLGNLNTSLKYFKSAEKIQPENKDLLNNMAVVLGMLGNFEESNRRFQKVLETNPDDKQALGGLAANYHHMGNEDLAKAYQQRASE